MERSHRQARLSKVEALPDEIVGDVGYLLEAHLQMLSGSRLIRGAVRRIADERCNAEAAVGTELKQIADDFATIADPYIAARIQDIRDVGLRLLRNLMRAPYRAFSSVGKGSIVIADELTPADIALMDPRIIHGFAASMGGQESHAAIMARSLRLPAVLGASGLIGGIAPGDTVIIDGEAGQVTVDPSEATLAHYRQARAANRRRQRVLAGLRNRPAITRDGVEIRLQANIELPGELETVRAVGAEGIGLLRTEYLYMNREGLPSEEEQYQAMRSISRPWRSGL